MEVETAAESAMLAEPKAAGRCGQSRNTCMFMDVCVYICLCIFNVGVCL